MTELSFPLSEFAAECTFLLSLSLIAKLNRRVFWSLIGIVFAMGIYKLLLLCLPEWFACPL